MTFSFLRSYAARQKSSIITSYLVSSFIYAGLILCLVLPNTATLQLFLIYLNLVLSVFLLLIGCVSEQVLLKTVRMGKYSTLIDCVQAYNFRAKHSVFSTLYSCVGVILIIANMLVLGLVWQPIVYLLCTLVGYLATNETLDNLPAIVNQFDLKEEDFQ